MAKAILVLDEMYKTCSECPLQFYSDVLGVQCAAEHRSICEAWEDIDRKERADWCPLKEEPEVEPEYNPDIHPCYEPFDAGYIEGWNDCLKAIMEE